MRRMRPLLSWILIIAGVGIGLWTIAVWQWQDPVTAIYTAHRQAQLRSELERNAAAFGAIVPQEPSREAPRRKPPTDEELGRLAESFDAHAVDGAPLGTLVVPRLGLRTIFVNGTDEDDLRGGPGRDPRSALPGQRRLVYVAGHRTTYGAPFANIDRLSPGDKVILMLPYAVVTYRVTGTRIVDAQDLSVLEPGTRERLVLQACHPRFFASQRLLVYATPTRVRPAPLHF